MHNGYNNQFFTQEEFLIDCVDVLKQLDTDDARMHLLKMYQGAGIPNDPIAALKTFDADNGRTEALQHWATVYGKPMLDVKVFKVFDTDSGRLFALKWMMIPRKIHLVAESFKTDTERAKAVNIVARTHKRTCLQPECLVALNNFYSDSGRLSVVSDMITYCGFTCTEEELLANFDTECAREKVRQKLGLPLKNGENQGSIVASYEGGIECHGFNCDGSLNIVSIAKDTPQSLIDAVKSFMNPHARVTFVSQSMDFKGDSEYSGRVGQSIRGGESGCVQTITAPSIGERCNAIGKKVTTLSGGPATITTKKGTTTVTWISADKCRIDPSLEKSYVADVPVMLDNVVFRDEKGGTLYIHDDIISASSEFLLVDGVRMPRPFSEPVKANDEKGSERRGLCVICLTHIATRVAIPCGHQCYCETCASNVINPKENTCPV